MDEAKTHLSKGAEHATRSEPAARPEALKRGDSFASVVGSWQGQVKVADDFDELPTDLAESLGVTS